MPSDDMIKYVENLMYGRTGVSGDPVAELFCDNEACGDSRDSEIKKFHKPIERQLSRDSKMQYGRPGYGKSSSFVEAAIQESIAESYSMPEETVKFIELPGATCKTCRKGKMRFQSQEQKELGELLEKERAEQRVERWARRIGSMNQALVDSGMDSNYAGMLSASIGMNVVPKDLRDEGNWS